MNQKQMILADLEKGVVLTPWKAILDYGCTKLSTRIGELNDPRIHKTTQSRVNRFGVKVHFMSYWIPETLRK